jgi:hypothetical protein
MDNIFEKHITLNGAKSGTNHINSDFICGFEYCKRQVMQILVFQKTEIQKEAFKSKCLEWVSEIECEIDELKREKNQVEIKSNKLAMSGRIKESNDLEYTENRRLEFAISEKQRLIKQIKGIL